MKELSIAPFPKVMRGIEVRNILSNSFGFGGNNSTLILSKTN
jgi:3-oxoacyl-[acyl-carrier-protein] synthase-1